MNVLQVVKGVEAVEMKDRKLIFFSWQQCMMLSLVAAVMATGCAQTWRVYQGQRLPREQIAGLNVSGTQVLQIDGHQNSTCPADHRCRIELLPGWHEVTLALREPVSFFHFVEPSYWIVLVFNAEAGHSYGIGYTREMSRSVDASRLSQPKDDVRVMNWDAWIYDKANDERVTDSSNVRRIYP